MTKCPLILICDDDPVVHESLSIYLDNENFAHISAYDGLTALQMKEAEKPDMIVLDLMMPGLNGIDVCRTIRNQDKTPIIMLTAKGEEIDRILGLELGADDYIVKPFDMKELVARIKAVIRRYQSPEPVEANKALTFPGLTVNISQYTVNYMGKELEMPPKELELLNFLASHPNQVFTREQLLDHIWGYEYVGDTRTVDVHIKRIREKINDHEKWALSTVWGIGYKFETR
jgi:DNA-binding response OmpR family regulator